MISAGYRAAIIQMNSGTKLQENLEEAYQYITEAASQGARVVGLPENFSFLGGLSMRMEQAPAIAEKVPSFLSETAEEYGIFLMGGSYPVPLENGKVFNRSTIYSPEGKRLASYDKIHLFDVTLNREEAYRESEYVEAGSPRPVVFRDETIGNWGLSVCYDLRFPELYRLLVSRGAEVLSVPSAFTYTTGQDHWKPLLRARAIENASYVLAPAQTGIHGDNRKTWGHAMIIDPWGQILVDAGQEPGIGYTRIDPKRIQQVRESIPSLEHRRV
ncbi:carbon-nitrogen hydrolase family protein [Fodinibius sediminis]|uniref:Predicted amidohydrolase n=1 Tax=Fodinibius sediminis TaxID=1214077 RepID=A0A521CQW5_9BACT|nr:carbon-nitrogen hydrolase family protein [Fodinibius sediminis]SMO61859.1 Predicted amidohydrolase [Fodinibius sediminis]